MNRKYFLSSLALLSAAIPPLSALAGKSMDVNLKELKAPKIPPYLKTGDTIGITCPAGYITLDEILPAVKLMENWGYKAAR